MQEKKREENTDFTKQEKHLNITRDKKEDKVVEVSMKELLEAGVHFGHQTNRWNPKMKPYIYGKRNGIYIIDLAKTQEMLEKALLYIEEQVANGKEPIIVSTKKQAQDIIEEEAKRAGAFYVNVRWLGGLLTNFHTIRKSIEKLKEYEKMKTEGEWEKLNKKEQSKLEKVYRKLYKNLNGVKNMEELPGFLIVIDTEREKIAVLEAIKKNIPIVGVVDTNGNPEIIDYPIPGNDDAIRSIKLFASKFADAILEGRKKREEKETIPVEKEEEAVSGEETNEDEIEEKIGKEE